MAHQEYAGNLNASLAAQQGFAVASPQPGHVEAMAKALFNTGGELAVAIDTLRSLADRLLGERPEVDVVDGSSTPPNYGGELADVSKASEIVAGNVRDLARQIRRLSAL